MGKIQLCLRWTKLGFVGLLSAVATLILLFTVSLPRPRNVVNFKPGSPQIQPSLNVYLSDSPEKENLVESSQNSDRIARFSLIQNEFHRSTRNKSKSSWIVLSGNVVVHEGIYNNPHNYSYIVNNNGELCKSFDSDRLRLLVFVESDVRHNEQRKMIRETWGVRMLQQSLNFRLVFLLGSSLTKDTQDLVLEENFLYGDIVQENFTESFNNLGLKSVMGLKWTSEYCQQADFVMKTDDDIFVHVPNLLSILSTTSKHRSLICHRNRVRKIIRQNILFAKYEVQSRDLPGIFFPYYCAGFCYVMSRDVVNDLYRASVITPYFFIEDVYITGFCRYKAQVHLTDHPAITLGPTLNPTQASCAFAEGRVTSHELTGGELELLWEQVNTQGFFCPRLLKHNETET